jgi:entericidin B
VVDSTNPTITMKTASKFTQIAFVALLLSLITVTGCRTMEGAGKDIERAGEKIQDNAK